MNGSAPENPPSEANWHSIRLQNLGAIVFNALGAAAALLAVAGGGRSLTGPLILAAATFFTLALTYWAGRAGRTVSVARRDDGAGRAL